MKVFHCFTSKNKRQAKTLPTCEMNSKKITKIFCNYKKKKCYNLKVLSILTYSLLYSAAQNKV